MTRPAALPAGAGAQRRRFHAVVALAGVGFGLTAPFTALLVVGLGGPPEWAAWVVSSMGLSLLVVDYFGTAFVPRLASRVALTTSMLVFGVGSLVSALTTSWLVVGLARVLQGFGAALFMGGGVVLAVRLVGDAGRGGAIGTFNAAWFVGIAAGPIGGGLVASTIAGPDGLRLLFGVCAAVNLLGAVAAWWFAPRWTSPVRPRLGPPRALGVRGRRARSVLVLVALGQAVRSGIALTLVPLLGEQLGLGRLPLGGALFALALADVAAMHFGAALSDRRGRVVPLAVATAWGAVVALAMAALVTDALWFAVGALAVGVTVGATWVLPMAMIVDLAADPEPALAAGRIASDVGMLAGGLLAGVGIAVAGIAGALVGAAALLVGGLLLTCAVGETLPAAGPSTSRPSTVSPEVRMPLPPIDRLAVLAENQDITLTPQRLAQAHATHAGYRPDLERLRALPLPFLDPTTEPGCAAAWIERGGRS